MVNWWRELNLGPESRTTELAERLRRVPTLQMIALGFAGAFRRSELVALTMADLVEAPDGYRVVIRHSKTDQEGQGQEVAIPRAHRLRPVEAVQTWLAAEFSPTGVPHRGTRRSGVAYFR